MLERNTRPGTRRAGRSARPDLAVRFPAAAGIRGVDGVGDLDAGAEGDQLRQLLVDAEGVGDATAHVRKCTRGFVDETWNVTRDVLARWTYIIETLADDPMQLEREVDWVIKQRVIQAYMEKNRLSWRDPKVSLMDLQYHDIRPDKGLYWSLVRRGLVDRITTDEAIERAKHLPPQTTRARLRGEFIRQANLKGKDYRVDWVYLKLNDPERETILCKDPFQSHDERVERLIRSF